MRFLLLRITSHYLQTLLQLDLAILLVTRSDLIVLAISEIRRDREIVADKMRCKKCDKIELIVRKRRRKPVRQNSMFGALSLKLSQSLLPFVRDNSQRSASIASQHGIHVRRLSER